MSRNRAHRIAPGIIPSAANRFRSKGMPGVSDSTRSRTPQALKRGTQGNICLRRRAFSGKGGKAGGSHKTSSHDAEAFFCKAWGAGPDSGSEVLRSAFLSNGAERWANTKKDETERFRPREGKGGIPVSPDCPPVNQSSSVGRMVSTGQVAFFTTFSATEPNRIRSMPLRPRVPITMMSACSLSARARISSAA